MELRRTIFGSFVVLVVCEWPSLRLADGLPSDVNVKLFTSIYCLQWNNRKCTSTETSGILFWFFLLRVLFDLFFLRFSTHERKQINSNFQYFSFVVKQRRTVDSLSILFSLDRRRRETERERERKESDVYAGEQVVCKRSSSMLRRSKWCFSRKFSTSKSNRHFRSCLPSAIVVDGNPVLPS